MSYVGSNSLSSKLDVYSFSSPISGSIVASLSPSIGCRIASFFLLFVLPWVAMRNMFSLVLDASSPYLIFLGSYSFSKDKKITTLGKILASWMECFLLDFVFLVTLKNPSFSTFSFLLFDIIYDSYMEVPK
jgi:hypothetical protein